MTIDLEEDLAIEQDGKRIILEKGDKIEILKEEDIVVDAPITEQKIQSLFYKANMKSDEQGYRGYLLISKKSKTIFEIVLSDDTIDIWTFDNDFHQMFLYKNITKIMIVGNNQLLISARQNFSFSLTFEVHKRSRIGF